MNEYKLSVIIKELSGAKDTVNGGKTVIFGYEKELARLALMSAGRSASELFISETADVSLFGKTFREVTEILPRGESGARFARCFTELYKKHFGKIDASDIFKKDEEYGAADKIAFVSGTGADSAYGIFSVTKTLGGKITPLHCQRISEAADAAASGAAAYTVIPVRNSADGRLRSFYKIILGYDFKICSAAYVGEDRYALCTRSFMPMSDAPRFCEISLPADGGEAADIISAAGALGAEISEISSAPSERDGEIYSFTFALSGDYRPLLLYLNLYHPRYTIVGLYDMAN